MTHSTHVQQVFLTPHILDYTRSNEASGSITPSCGNTEQSFCLHDDGQVTSVVAAE
jgi:hypothetical protein